MGDVERDVHLSLPHIVVEEEDEEVEMDDVEGDVLLSLPHMVVEEEYEEEEMDDIEEEGFLLLPHMETPATFSVTSERRRCLKQCCVEYQVEGGEQYSDGLGRDLYNWNTLKQ